MKKVLGVLFLAFLCVTQAFAVPIVTKQGSFSVTNQTLDLPDISGSGVNLHKIVTVLKGTSSACTMKLQGSNNNGVSYSDIISSTCTTNTASTQTSAIYAKYRLILTSWTATSIGAEVVVSYAGYLDVAGIGAGSSICGSTTQLIQNLAGVCTGTDLTFASDKLTVDIGGIAVPGSSSGTATIIAPAAASTPTLTLPIVSGTFALTKGSITGIGSLATANFNITTDQTITLSCSGAYILRGVIVTNPSTSLTTAAGGVYTATSKGGVALVAAVQTYTPLTAAAKYLDTALVSATTTDTYTANPLYLSLTAGQGGAATADVYVVGECL